MIEKDFDCYQRYTALKNLLDAALPVRDTAQAEPVRVLDVGAGTSPLSIQFLGAGYSIVRCDVVAIGEPDTVVLTPGQPLPFPDGAFDAVIAMDVLEHVEPGQRPMFVRECTRVARDICVIAVPDGSPQLAAAEARVYAIHEAYLGKHAFFEEHKDYGVPGGEDVMQMLSGSGKRISSFPNVPLAAWEAFSCLDFVAYSDAGTQQLTIPVHMAQNESTASIASNEAHYRRFYVACDSAAVHERVRTHIDALLQKSAPGTSRSIFYPIWQCVAALCRKNQALDSALYQHQGELSRLGAELQQTRHAAAIEAAALKERLHQADSELLSLRHAFAEQEQTLRAIVTSRTWRYSQFVRSLAGLLRK